MDEKKLNTIMIWIVIAVLLISQAVGAYQDYQIHQRFRLRIESLQNQNLKLFHQMNENHEYLEFVLEIIEAY